MAAGFGKTLERMMAMDDAAWARHANPWSGWTRLSALPLLVLAIWSRVWLGWGALLPVGVVILWIWLNPRVFPIPASTENWMSRGVLGERIWLAHDTAPVAAHHLRVTRVLTIAAGLGLIPLAWGLVALDIGLTVAGLVLSMGAKLWFIDRMVWIKADHDRKT